MPPPPPASSSEAEQPPQPPSDDGPVVLVLDDEPLMRQMLEDWLRRDGFSVILASHSTEAFTVLINTRVDCVVADLKLDRRSGVHDGVDLLDRVALSYPHVGRIVFTAHPEEVPGKAFTAHVVVRKDGPPYELVIAIIAEIERRSSVAPQNPG